MGPWERIQRRNQVRLTGAQGGSGGGAGGGSSVRLCDLGRLRRAKEGPRSSHGSTCEADGGWVPKLVKGCLFTTNPHTKNQLQAGALEGLTVHAKDSRDSRSRR